MSNSLESIDPYKLAKQHKLLHGSIPVASMPRLIKLLASEQGEVLYSIEFNHDPDSRCVISGELQANLSMRCQRCMQVFWKLLDSNFKVSPAIDDEAAKSLPDQYDPVITSVEGKLNISELLEDELILAMPIVAMHGGDGCRPVVDNGGKEKAQDLVHPFRVLQDLKFNKKAKQAEDKNGGTTES